MFVSQTSTVLRPWLLYLSMLWKQEALGWMTGDVLAIVFLGL